MMRFARRPVFHAASRLLFFLAGISFAGVATLCAQGLDDGVLHGQATDVTDQPTPWAEVTVQDLESGERRVSHTLADGSFAVGLLAPGEYSVEVRGTPAVDVSVQAGDTSEVRLPRRSAAGVPRSPDADGASAPDENDDGLESRRGLAPSHDGGSADGVSTTGALGNAPLGSGSAPGIDADDDADSAERTSGPTHGLGRGRHTGVSYRYAQGAVREFRLGTGSYSAQLGSGGGALTRTSLSGGAALHGSVFLNVQSSALAAANPFSIASSYADGVVTSGVVKPHDLAVNFGATAGGPPPAGVKWLRRFRYFGAFELQRRGYPAISAPADPNFFRLTTIERALLGTRGLGEEQVQRGLGYLSSLTGKTARRADETLLFARVDWRPATLVDLAAEYNRVRWSSPAGLLEAPVVARGRASLGDAEGSLDQAILRVAAHGQGGLAGEIRAGYTRDLQFERPQLPLAQEPAIGPGGLVPEVNIGPNGFLFGTPASLSQRAYPDEQQIELGAKLSLVRGHHLFEAGGSFVRVDERIATLTNAAGTFHYDSGETKGHAGGLVDFLTDQTFSVNGLPDGGCPRIAAAVHDFCFRSFTQSFGEEQVRFLTQDWTGFAEETWRASLHRRAVVLHAGVRYEYTLLPFPQRANPAIDAIFGARGATGVFPEDRNNFGPRVSASFEPFGSGHGLVKLGFGAYFGRLPGATIKAALSDTGRPSATTRIRIRPTAITACPQVPSVGFGFPCSFLAAPAGVVAATTSAVVFDKHFRLPVVQQASVALERNVGGRTSLLLTYVLNLDRQLPGSTDLNIAPSTSNQTFRLVGGTGQPGVQDGEVFAVPLYTARISPQFGPVTDIVSRSNASYHGLTVHGQSRLPGQLSVSAEYTWSKSIDFGQSASSIPRTNSQFDPYSIAYDKGLSSLNYPEVLHASLVWASRGGRRGRLASGRGWNVAVVESARSGRPFTYDLFGGASLPGGHTSLNGSGGALYLPTVGRNSLRLPPAPKTDLRLGHDVRLSERVRGRVSAEATNLFNHQIVSSVSQRAFLVEAPVAGVTPLVFQDAATIAAEGYNSVPFGKPTAASSGQSRERQIRLSATINF